MSDYEKLSFRLFTVGITLIFLWIVSPYAGAVLWSVVFAILFSRLKDRIAARIGGRQTLASVLTLLVLIALVILPFFMVAGLVLNEAASLYHAIRSGSIDVGSVVGKVLAVVPEGARSLLSSAGLGNQSEALATLSDGLVSGLSWLTALASGFGQSAFGLIIGFSIALYVTFFLLRDGKNLIRRIEDAVPISRALFRTLADEFASVVRATVRGSLVVAAAQGVVGGIIFALLGISAAPLWGTLMGVLSLLPAVGTGLVWAPVAVYLLVSGAYLKAIILILCGLLVIGMLDTILRPILVGREIKMPDYLILVSSLGGVAVAGFNGLILGPIVAAMFLVVWNTNLRSSAVDAPLRGEAADGSRPPLPRPPGAEVDLQVEPVGQANDQAPLAISGKPSA